MRHRRSHRHSPKETYQTLEMILLRLQRSKLLEPDEVSAIEGVMNDLWADMNDEERKMIVLSVIAETDPDSDFGDTGD